MGRAKVVASAAVICHVNGKPYGRVRDFQFTSGTPRKVQYGLDSTEPYELIPTTTKVVGRLTLFRTSGDAGAEGAGMTSRYEEFPREKYFSLMLIERGSDTTLFEARYCSVTSQTWTVPEKGIVTGTIEFEALDWSNELRPGSL